MYNSKEDGLPDILVATDEGGAEVVLAVGLLPAIHRYADEFGLAHAVPDVGQVRLVPLAKPARPRWVVFAPIADPDPIGHAGAVQRALLAAPRTSHVAVRLQEMPDDSVISAIAEGAVLAGYGRGLPRQTHEAERVTIVIPHLRGHEASEAVTRGCVMGSAMNWTRQLVDTPANLQSPLDFAHTVKECVDSLDSRILTCNLIEPDVAAWPALLAVASGSDRAPCVVRLSLNSGHGQPVALLGKGVTFDAGGLDIKSFDQMAGMRRDMAGAATVASALVAAARLDVTTAVEATLVLTDNTIGGSAMRPGDIIKHSDGSTTEITDTDSEGRLILADAFLDIQSSSPSCLVDVATLTGGGGLGPECWAIIGSSSRLVTSLLAAGNIAGEPGCALPLIESYRRYLDSPFADRQNSAGSFRYGFDTLLAARFLADFAGGLPFAHLDISAVASRDGLTSDATWKEGATGIPTRTVIQWIESGYRDG